MLVTTSGKGGVGKSSVTGDLAVTIARLLLQMGLFVVTAPALED